VIEAKHHEDYQRPAPRESSVEINRMSIPDSGIKVQVRHSVAMHPPEKRLPPLIPPTDPAYQEFLARERRRQKERHKRFAQNQKRKQENMGYDFDDTESGDTPSSPSIQDGGELESEEEQEEEEIESPADASAQDAKALVSEEEQEEEEIESPADASEQDTKALVTEEEQAAEETLPDGLAAIVDASEALAQVFDSGNPEDSPQLSTVDTEIQEAAAGEEDPPAIAPEAEGGEVAPPDGEVEMKKSTEIAAADEESTIESSPGDECAPEDAEIVDLGDVASLVTEVLLPPEGSSGTVHHIDSETFLLTQANEYHD
jgi:hypothetical protein